MARPSKLTTVRQRRIVDAVAAGNYGEVAARAAGIAPSTLYEWKARGEEGGPGNERYVEFLEALTHAEAEAEIAGVEAIRGAWNKDWRSAAEYLARRYPERWGKRDRSSAVEDSRMSLMELEQLVDAEAASPGPLSHSVGLTRSARGRGFALSSGERRTIGPLPLAH